MREKLDRHRRRRLSVEARKLDRREERALAEEGAITSQPQRAGFPLTHPVESLRLPKTSWVKISQVRTVSMERLGRRIGALNTDEVDRIIEGLFELVG